MKQLLSKIKNWYHDSFHGFYLIGIQYTYYVGLSIEICTISCDKFNRSLFELTINKDHVCGYLFYKEFYLIKFNNR